MEHGVGDTFLVVGKLNNAVSLNLVGKGKVMFVQRPARRVKLRDYVEFQELVCAFAVAVYVKINRLVAVLQFLEADSYRLFRLDCFLWSCHIQRDLIEL